MNFHFPVQSLLAAEAAAVAAAAAKQNQNPNPISAAESTASVIFVTGIVASTVCC